MMYSNEFTITRKVAHSDVGVAAEAVVIPVVVSVEGRLLFLHLCIIIFSSFFSKKKRSNW